MLEGNFHFSTFIKLCAKILPLLLFIRYIDKNLEHIVNSPAIINKTEQIELEV